VRASLALGYRLNKPLFELRPDIFPYDFAGSVELELWGRFIKKINKK